MKFLFVLAFLSISVNASASVDLSCSGVGRSNYSENIKATLVKQGDKIDVATTTYFPNSEIAHSNDHLTILEAKKNQLWETIYSGTGLTQTNIDVFDNYDFVLRVPQVLENGVTLTYTKKGSFYYEMKLNCVRPDNR